MGFKKDFIGPKNDETHLGEVSYDKIRIGYWLALSSNEPKNTRGECVSIKSGKKHEDKNPVMNETSKLTEKMSF